MKCTYVTTEDEHALGAWQMQRKIRVLTAIIIFLLATIFASIFVKPWQPDVEIIPFFFLLAVVFIICAIRIFRKSPDRKFRKQLIKVFRQANSATEVETTLSLDNDCLILEDRTGLTRKRFEEIHKMRESQDFFFHYLSDGMAHVIPKAPLQAEMIETLRSLVKK